MSNILNFKKIKGLITVIIITVIISIFYFSSNNINILFLANLIICILIIKKAKASYFSIKTIIINYILFSIFYQYNFGASYGILEITTIKIYYQEINLLIYLYNIICYIWISYTNILKNEKELFNIDFKNSNLSIYICSIVAIIAAIIAFPGLPFDKEYLINRFDGLIIGNAWNHISIVALLFIMPSLKKSNLAKISYVFVVFWFLSHYERVDIIGLISFYIIYKLSINKDIKFKNYIGVGIIGLLVVFFLVYLGESRANNNVNLLEIAGKMLLQNTAADIGYVFNSSIDYSKNFDLMYGKTYVTYFIKILPLLDSKYNTNDILKDIYNTPGGEYILSEPLINFGLAGVVIFQLIEFLIYTWILSKKSKYRFLLYSILIITTFRTSWYGWIYVEKAIIYFIPIMYFLTKTIDNFEKKKISGGD